MEARLHKSKKKKIQLSLMKKSIPMAGDNCEKRSSNYEL